MTLKTYLTDRLTTIGNQLDFVSADYDLIVADTLELLGITSESEVTPLALHSVAKVLFWRKALEVVSVDFSYSADGASYSKSDLHASVMKSLQIAESEAMNYLPNYVIEIGSLKSEEDPYAYSEERDLSNNL